ncbi:MAG: DNA-processing protein DprA [Vicinamibacterales bacterium]
MTLDRLVALSLLAPAACPDLLNRLAADDPSLDDLARPRLADARAALALAEAAGIACLAVTDTSYPVRLTTIPDPPPVIWLRGDPLSTAGPAVAIVGSRAASPVALEVAFSLAAGVARAGVTVVSGMARGVDGAAHRGALTAGRTVGVLGSGVDVVYPRGHRTLAEAVVAHGALVSEFPPGTPPLAHHFPQRNRVISGLADAVVIVEAAERSGSLITARLALEQGRDVLAVPGSVAGGRNRGGHALIRDGAALVESAEDVFRELGWLVPAAREAEGAGSPEPTGLVALMPPGEACSLDWLAARVDRPVPAVLAELLELELAGAVSRTGGGGFMRSAGTCYRS